MIRLKPVVVLIALCCLLSESVVTAKTVSNTHARDSITNTAFEWPPTEQWLRLFLLRDYNTRIVLLGTMFLGCAAGMVGSFTLLRKRALMGDALSHATLPGIVLAFMLGTTLGWDGKSLPLLLLGATLTGLLGVASILAIRHGTRLKDDTALGAVLSVFFGAGVALLGVAQDMQAGNAAGLEGFIYGRTASMNANDAKLITIAAIASITVSLLLFKELKLLCFDDKFAGSEGYPLLLLDWVLMALVVVVTIVGLQAVGLILMIALLIIPAAAARFWTEQMWQMTCISAGLGLVSGLFGAGISALFSRLPSGAMIVLVCTLFFLVSMVFGTARGVLVRWLRRRKLNQSVDRQHLLRAIFEIQETAAVEATTARTGGITLEELISKRSWTPSHLQKAIRRNTRENLVVQVGERIRLTDRGKQEAVRLTRQHRLWELYLITHADIAPNRVDRDADDIEHVLEPEIVAELEALLLQETAGLPASPHEIGTGSQRTLGSLPAGEGS